ncbi:His-Xaa-Ser system radical SAM maturase HxsC [Parvularcula flava]|uniref:His-Xaa-Ser system radical SAM maturase HxsC n=1 Tax=Aquisalinus luteolus TaxID=1566827 RepID=A0A8J3ETP0_9PROT|nr:His-Xaa-Ser system radical SAM maturase HxsC [Aquisalinus luteolus]NHK27159.1 His-Xaa-Ser system radical SAM maturase HxsC [Aquisalinus luteolus]GGH94576.1 hypothetical protein GCM10011355_09090 [Aquisalinus luteolus]
MTPLALSCDIVGGTGEPFVALLAEPGKHNVNVSHAVLTGQEGPSRFYQFGECTFRIKAMDGESLTGDIIYVDPHKGRAERWIRAGSNHNTLLVTEQCDQLCVMCSQPPKKTHHDQFAFFEQACQLAPPAKTIGLSGGEPLLHKAPLFAMLERLHTCRPDLRFHVLTNGQHFTPADQRQLKKLTGVCWGIPLYAADAILHDRLVGKDGAFSRLMESLPVLARSGAAIELRTVLMEPNSQALDSLARFITNSVPFIDVWAIMQLENIGYARNSWNELFHDHSDDFSALGETLAFALLHGIEVALYNFPRCTLPSAWRPYAPRSISDWKNRYAPTCSTCRERDACAGFFEWHPDDRGYKRITPL